MKTSIIPHRGLKALTTSIGAIVLALSSVHFASAGTNTGTGPNANVTTSNGDNALLSVTTGINNSAYGIDALRFTTTGTNNIAVGAFALRANTSGSYNAGVGYGTLYSNVGGNYNAGFGYACLYSNTSGTYNLGFGYLSLYSNTNGIGNTATGSYSLFLNSSGSFNNASGLYALYNNTLGNYNVAVGNRALYNNATGNNNGAFGFQALNNNTAGNNNLAVGDGALYNTTGSLNIGIGKDAGFNLTTGNNNIAIGAAGVAGESNIIRLGNATHLTTYIAGTITGNGAGLTGLKATSITGQIGTLQIAPGAVTTALIAPGAVTTALIAPGAVTTALLAPNSVTTLQLAPGSVLAADLGPDVGLWSPAGTGVYRPTGRVIVDGTSGIDTTNFTGMSMQYDQSFGEGALMSSYNDGFSKLTFYTKAGTGQPITQRMVIDRNGLVGIGTTAPGSLLDVNGNVNVATTLTVNGTSTLVGNVGIGAAPTGYALNVSHGGGTGIHVPSTAGFSVVDIDAANGDSALRLASAGTIQWGMGNNGGNLNIFQYGNGTKLMVQAATGNVGIGNTAPSTKLDVAGEITCTALNVTSDRNAKEGFKPVNAREVLDKVARLPITEWQYKTQPDARHIGPMAQDFHAAFAVGRDERHITSVDEDGVALAAIQGLNEKLDETRAENAELKRSVKELKSLVEQLARQSSQRKAK